MLYKGIEVEEINLLVTLKSKSNTSFKENQKVVFEWCQKNGIKAAVECPYIDDNTLEALVYIYLPVELLETAYEKAVNEFDKAVVSLHLRNFTKEGHNEVDLTLDEYKELCS
jgi:hypothetical protein